ncbi:MAG TPA: thermonuclease family protein [Pyrinomonadaceae bacterium]|nr:thermonuclease family protein [Pyrinomonadaceae bacterium]
MNKISFSIALILLVCCPIVFAQNERVDKYVWEKQNDGNYGCKYDGDGGHIDLFEKGKIIQILDGNTIIFKGEKGQKRKVKLIAVDSDANEKKAKTFLEESALNKDAELTYSSSQSNSKNVNGIIEINGKDINRLMLELGLVKYKDSKVYQISYFNDCVYFRTEDKARSGKLGIWAK